MSNKSRRTPERSVRTLAVDPGYGRLGVAVLDDDRVQYSACIETSASDDIASRLAEIERSITNLIAKYKPTELAIETLYFSKNRKTALSVAQSRGVLLAAASRAHLAVHEYSPQAVKLAVTGYGASSKKAVAHMVSRLTGLSLTGILDDELDAIALGFTHAASARLRKKLSTE